MKKIAILTLFHRNYNWGGVLQGYALRRKIISIYESIDEEVSVDILKYHSNYNIIYPTKLSQLTQYTVIEIIKKLFSKIADLISQKRDTTIQSNLLQRKKVFDKFTETYTTNNKLYDDERLKNISGDYFAIISGSDQVWNPNVARKGFFQSDIDGNCIKISYAASIARNSLSKRELSVMVPLIDRFDSISVRENSAKKILDKYVKKNICEVIDPTFLITKEEWGKLLNPPEEKREKYALVFFFSDSLKYREKLGAICEQKNMKIKFIPHTNGYRKNDELGRCERFYTAGPLDFLELVRDAEYVFTDSFHGAVFSIIFQKKFFVFKRDKEGRISKNTRLIDLLNKFELENRLVNSVFELEEKIDNKIDYNLVKEKLEIYTKESEKFLINSLKISQ